MEKQSFHSLWESRLLNSSEFKPFCRTFGLVPAPTSNTSELIPLLLSWAQERKKEGEVSCPSNYEKGCFGSCSLLCFQSKSSHLLIVCSYAPWQVYLTDTICYSCAWGRKLVSSVSVGNHIKTNTEKLVVVSNILQRLKPVMFISWVALHLGYGQMPKSLCKLLQTFIDNKYMTWVSRMPMRKGC